MPDPGDSPPPEPADRFLVQNRQRGFAVDTGGLAGFLERVVRDFAPGDRRGATLRLVSDVRMRELNRRFRGRDAPTDVLAFPADPPIGAEAEVSDPEAGGWLAEEPYLGDLVVSAPTAARQAAASGWDLDTELRTLALHGVLHLFGYDHETDRGEMDRLEALLRKRHGLPVGAVLPADAGAGAA